MKILGDKGFELIRNSATMKKDLNHG
jgi:hypothetical protein